MATLKLNSQTLFTQDSSNDPKINRLVLNEATQIYNFSGTITFSNCSATGRFGPTLAQARSTYTSQPFQSTWLNNTFYFNVVFGVQYFLVPKSGLYTIRAKGAPGNPGNSHTLSSHPLLGADVSTTFQLYAGERIRIVCGQKGSPVPSGGLTINYNTGAVDSGSISHCGGAGGASCMSVQRMGLEIPIIVAGGGGGNSQNIKNVLVADSIKGGATKDTSNGPEGGKGGNWDPTWLAGDVVNNSSSNHISHFWGAGGGGGWAQNGHDCGINGLMPVIQNGGNALSSPCPMGGKAVAQCHGGFGGGGASGVEGGAGAGGGGYKGGDGSGNDTTGASTSFGGTSYTDGTFTYNGTHSDHGTVSLTL